MPRNSFNNAFRNAKNVKNDEFYAIYEDIYVLTKDKNTIFKRKKDAEHKTDIWTINTDRHNDHPAPFPIDIPRNILHNIDVEEGRDIIVLDPFMGSGTTAKAAIEKGYDFIGFEIVPEYIESFIKKDTI